MVKIINFLGNNLAVNAYCTLVDFEVHAGTKQNTLGFHDDWMMLSFRVDLR
jgi:hypothetical protein